MRRVPATRRSLGLGLLDVLGRDQVEDDRHQSGVLDAFVARRRIVDRDGGPENLAHFEAAARRVEALVEFVDLVGEEATDRGAEDAGKLGVQQMTQRAVERLAITGVVGLPAWEERMPMVSAPFFGEERPGSRPVTGSL